MVDCQSWICKSEYYMQNAFAGHTLFSQFSFVLFAFLVVFFTIWTLATLAWWTDVVRVSQTERHRHRHHHARRRKDKPVQMWPVPQSQG